MGKISKAVCQIGVQLIKAYQLFLSPLLGPRCRFYPTCSEYANEAILEFGLIKGVGKATKRLLCCHPFHAGGYDPVQK